MLGPLVILALLSLIGGWMGWPEALHGGNWFAHFLEPALNTVRDAGNGALVGTTKVELVTSSRLEMGLSGLAMLVAALGWFTAHMFYRRNPELPGKMAKSYAGIRTMLVNKYWVDEFYNAVIVQAVAVHLALRAGHGGGNGTWCRAADLLASGATLGLGGLFRRIQSGNIRSYAGWLALGAAAVLLISYFGFGTWCRLKAIHQDLVSEGTATIAD